MWVFRVFPVEFLPHTNPLKTIGARWNYQAQTHRNAVDACAVPKDVRGEAGIDRLMDR